MNLQNLLQQGWRWEVALDVMDDRFLMNEKWFPRYRISFVRELD